MSVQCPGSTSQPIPGLQDTVVLAGGAAGVLSLVPGLEWLVAVASGLGVFSYFLPTLCASDPPGYATFTLAEVEAFLTFQQGADYDSFIQKAEQDITTALWFQSCECVTGSVQPVSPPPAAPAVNINFGAPGAYPCYVKGPEQVGPLAVPAGTVILQDQKGPPLNIVGNLPDSITYAKADLTTVINSGTPNFKIGLEAFDASSTLVASDYHNVTTSTTLTSQFVIPSTARVIDVLFKGQSGSGSMTLSGSTYFYCNGALPVSQSQCCPPDPAVLQLLQQLNSLTTLIQRQAVPFAYVPGTTHSGLSGSGELTVAGLLGAKISPTSIPSYAGIAAGDPDTYWLESWINWGNADGWTSREWLRTAPYLSLPPLAGQFTKLGYSLAPGLVVDITELKREP